MEMILGPFIRYDIIAVLNNPSGVNLIVPWFKNATLHLLTAPPTIVDIPGLWTLPEPTYPGYAPLTSLLVMKPQTYAQNRGVLWGQPLLFKMADSSTPTTLWGAYWMNGIDDPWPVGYAPLDTPKALVNADDGLTLVPIVRYDPDGLKFIIDQLD